jgi:hypothetical protein
MLKISQLEDRMNQIQQFQNTNSKLIQTSFVFEEEGECSLSEGLHENRAGRIIQSKSKK